MSPVGVQLAAPAAAAATATTAATTTEANQIRRRGAVKRGSIVRAFPRALPWQYDPTGAAVDGASAYREPGAHALVGSPDPARQWLARAHHTRIGSASGGRAS